LLRLKGKFMKRKDKQSMREKTLAQLLEELSNRDKKLGESRVKLSRGQLKDTMLVPRIRDEIAVIKTIIRENMGAEANKNE